MVKVFMNITEMLFRLQDSAYADFQSKLTPGIPREFFVGVRVPQLRKMAKSIKKQSDPFPESLPHKYFEENLLHGLLISEIRDFDTCVEALHRKTIQKARESYRISPEQKAYLNMLKNI